MYQSDSNDSQIYLENICESKEGHEPSWVRLHEVEVHSNFKFPFVLAII